MKGECECIHNDEASIMICKRIRVFGRVQGVFYRATAKTKADDLNLVGWVKNEMDGTVLMEVEGEEDKVQEMIQWCNQGPLFSRVDDILHEPSNSTGRKEFEIIY
jgi:acylphosphatase